MDWHWLGNIKNLSSFDKTKFELARFVDFKYFDRELIVDLEDENILEILQFLLLSPFEVEDLLLNAVLDVVGDREYFLFLFLLRGDLLIVKGIGVRMAHSPVGLLNFLHINLRHPLVIETIPMIILKRFYVAEVMPMSSRPIVDHDRIKLIHKAPLF